MSKGEVDIDMADDKLQEQLLGVELKKRKVGTDNILLESKKEMQDRGVHSPDHADAAVYAATDLTPWLNREPVGTVKAVDRGIIPDYGLHAHITRPGMPLV